MHAGGEKVAFLLEIMYGLGRHFQNTWMFVSHC